MDFVAAAEQPIETDLTITADLFVKSYCIQKTGSFVPQHVHEFDHVSTIAYGGVKVWEDGNYRGERHAPVSFIIKAGVQHTFETLVDNTVLLCIHRLDEDGDVKILREHQLVEQPSCPSAS